MYLKSSIMLIFGVLACLLGVVIFTPTYFFIPKFVLVGVLLIALGAVFVIKGHRSQADEEDREIRKTIAKLQD